MEDDGMYLEMLPPQQEEAKSPEESPETISKLQAENLSQEFGPVEVIMIRYNLKETEDRAIKALYENTVYPFHLTDYNNYPKNKDLSRLWNELIEKSDCEYICLLNSDAFVSPGWLLEIMQGFQGFPNAGCVGPSGDHVGGVQRSLGGIQSASEHSGSFDILEGKDTLSGFCMVIKKSVWKEIGGFTNEVPFYGGEHAFNFMVREAGYKLVWAKGAWVYHEGEASAKKAGTHIELRITGPQQFINWQIHRVPILFTTYNRLDFTKQTFPDLVQKYPRNEIYVWDNTSTDETKKWLKKTVKGNKLYKNVVLNFSKKNVGVAGAMNAFLDYTVNKEFIAKVDNDTIVPADWLECLLKLTEYKHTDILQPKHPILHSKYKNFAQWMEHLPKIDHRLRQSSYVGGSGILIRRCKIGEERIEQTSTALSGWTQWQDSHPEIFKCFCSNIEIKLLDMIEDNKIDTSKYPDYYVETGRAKETTENKVMTTLSTHRAIARLITKNKLFSYTRYGDGELLMMENEFKGRDITQYNSKAFAKEIKEGFEIDDPNYLLAISAGYQNEEGMAPGLFSPFENDTTLQDLVKKTYDKKIFYNPVAYHYLSVFSCGEFKEFIDLLNTKKLGFAGGNHLREANKYLKIKHFVNTPVSQAYNSINHWYRKIKELEGKIDILLLAIGPTAKVVQKRLWKDGIKISTIDIGSVAAILANDENDGHTWLRLGKAKINKTLSLLTNLK